LAINSARFFELQGCLTRLRKTKEAEIRGFKVNGVYLSYPREVV